MTLLCLLAATVIVAVVALLVLAALAYAIATEAEGRD